MNAEYLVSNWSIALKFTLMILSNFSTHGVNLKRRRLDKHSSLQ